MRFCWHSLQVLDSSENLRYIQRTSYYGAFRRELAPVQQKTARHDAMVSTNLFAVN